MSRKSFVAPFITKFNQINMLSQIIEEEILKEFEKLWNEHDGTHFYKEEWKEFLLASLSRYNEEISKEIEKEVDQLSLCMGNEWDENERYNAVQNVKSRLISKLQSNTTKE